MEFELRIQDKKRFRRICPMQLLVFISTTLAGAKTETTKSLVLKRMRWHFLFAFHLNCHQKSRKNSLPSERYIKTYNVAAPKGGRCSWLFQGLVPKKPITSMRNDFGTIRWYWIVETSISRWSIGYPLSFLAKYQIFKINMQLNPLKSSFVQIV